MDWQDALVEPVESIEYVGYLQKVLSEFTVAFDEFMAMHDENPASSGFGAGILPAASPKKGADRGRIRELTDELDRLSGSLMELSEVTSIAIKVEGIGKVDPFVNWAAFLRPKPVLEASDVRGCIHRATGRLEALRARAEALAAPDLVPAGFHPLVWAAAQRLWNDGHLPQAVAAAAEAVSGQMKQLTSRNDTSDTSLWQQAFSEKKPVEGAPRLRWPGNSSDQNVKTMNDGLRQFAPGVNMVIRNPATHLGGNLSKQDALERLGTLSVLAKFVDRCTVVEIAQGSAD